MAFRRREATTVEDEREALRAQRDALEELKRELAERVAAVRERELELQGALADAGGARPGPPVERPPLPGRPRAEEADTDENVLAAAAVAERERDVVGRERTLDAREASLAEREHALERRMAEERQWLDAREQELQARAAAVAEAEEAAGRTAAGPEAAADAGRPAERDVREQSLAAREEALAARERELEQRREREDARLQAREQELAALAARPSGEVDEERLSRIEARLGELREAEMLFLRTRDELAARSEAVAARERLVAQKERELDEREDAAGGWGGLGLSEVEARLRRLEQASGGSAQGFSGGLKRLQQGSTRPQRPA